VLLAHDRDLRRPKAIRCEPVEVLARLPDVEDLEPSI
jgi:hypothetical protein